MKDSLKIDYKSRLKDLVKYKWHLLVYIFFLVSVIISVLYINAGEENIDFHQYYNDENARNWNYRFEDGAEGITDLPGNLPDNDSRHLWLSRTLPQIEDNTFFVFRARHVFVRVSVDGKVLFDNISGQEEKDQWYTLEGINYIEAELSAEDSGKELVVECYGSEPYYLCSPGGVFIGERGTFIIDMVKRHIVTFVCFVMLFLAGIVLLILWVCARFILKQDSMEILCLALFTLTISFWVLTESQITQIFGAGTRGLTLLAYEDLMLIPVPIALFFYYASERKRGKVFSKVIAVIPLIVFVINNGLHWLHIASLTSTLHGIQIMLAVELMFITYIQISEIWYIHKNHSKYSSKMGKLPLVGIAILVPFAFLEIFKYAHNSSRFQNGGLLITTGVFFYILTLAVDTLVRMAYRNTRNIQNSEMKTMFLANMSHEIRTPLNAMLGFNEAILQNTQDEKVRDYAYNIHEAGDELRGIINSILDVSKIEMGQLQIDSKEYNSLQLLDNVVSMFELLAQKKGLKFITDIDADLPETMIGDEQHLRQILTNILSNAVKYTDRGSVTLKVKVLNQNADKPLCRILFSVKDTGRGIRDEDRERLFQKFERLDTEHFKHTEGTGLGMSIVLHTLKAMGSDIKLKSVYGQGSEFYFELEQIALDKKPIGNFEEKRKDNSIKEVKSVSFRAPKAQILIVDDVEMNIDAVCALLEFSQMHMDKALSGAEAIEAVQKKHYDLIFMDHMMPGMDGIEATEKIRNLSVEKNDAYYAMVPIVALTANTSVGMREVYQQSGMQDLICKPVEVEGIISVLRKWLSKDLIEDTGQFEMDMFEKSEPDQAWQLEIEHIDSLAAKKYNSNLFGLDKNMRAFVAAYDKNSSQIEDLFYASDIKNYVIKVHGLKSTSKIIGAVGLSELARQIEEKGNQGKMDEADFHRLQKLYGDCVASLRKYLKLDQESHEAINDTEYLKLLQDIKEAADNFDAGRFLELEDALAKIEVPDDRKEEFEKIRDMVINLSFGELSEYLK